MRIFSKLLITAALLLLMSSCIKEPYYDGYWRYINDTSLDCALRIYTDRNSETDFVNLHIPSRDQRVVQNEAYDGGSCVLYKWRFASIAFSDGTIIEYTQRDGQAGNPLMENNYDIQLIDGKCHLTLTIKNAIHDIAVKQ